MRFRVIGCSHHNAPIAVRERLAFSPAQACAALERLESELPDVETVLLSTCNRVEVYLGCENGELPTLEQVGTFLATFHALDLAEVVPHLYERTDSDAIRHLFTVAASLDSMVVGEAQILAQVKQAYQQATTARNNGPLTHALFQGALKVARRVATETAIQQHRVSIPSVAVADFAQQIFERFDDKRTLVIGAGEMAEETLRYLCDEGARDVIVVNRSYERAFELAERWQGCAMEWPQRWEALAAADLVISTTGSSEPIVTLTDYDRLAPARYGKPLFVLDLAVPRDFEPAIGGRPGVYLYSVDDLQAACERNRRARDKELPAALRIVEQETERLAAELRHRAAAPVIQRLHAGWQEPKEDELQRLFHKLPELDDRARQQVRQSFDRLLNKLLHRPMESLRDESRHGIPHALLDALARLFQLRD